MAEFKNRKELEAWLQGQPREVCAVIATRTALRVLPLLAVEFSEGKLNPHAVASDILLRVIRATAVPWVEAKYSTQSKELAYAAADAVEGSFFDPFTTAAAAATGAAEAAASFAYSARAPAATAATAADCSAAVAGRTRRSTARHPTRPMLCNQARRDWRHKNQTDPP